jgi:hypothetical protein
MSFESRFASVGRWIDDRIWAIRSRRAGPSRVDRLKESLGENVRTATHAAHERLEQMRASRLDRDDPKVRRNLVAVGMVLVLCAGVAAGVVLGPRWFGQGGSALTPEELAALEKIKAAPRVEIFNTAPPPAPATDSDAAHAPGRPGTKPGTGGGLLPPGSGGRGR